MKCIHIGVQKISVRESWNGEQGVFLLISFYAKIGITYLIIFLLSVMINEHAASLFIIDRTLALTC
jgi:hypothetical protein